MDMCTTDAMLVIYGQLAKTINTLRNTKNISAAIVGGANPPPTAFLSYSWESEEHKNWVRALSTRLRNDGINAKLDQWHAVPGDQLPQFMEREIRENDYVLIICTPHYRKKSDDRTGGVGYEGDVMTAEVYLSKNDRKYIPILAKGEWNEASPSWLRGKYGIDLRDGSDFQRGYDDLITTIHGTRAAPPPIGSKPLGKKATPAPYVAPISSPVSVTASSKSLPSDPAEPLKILGVIVDEVTEPNLDGTPGSALYRVPFKLSKKPSSLWSDLFIQTWNRPPRFTSMHRPGIATVTGNKIILDGTTIEEVERYHRDTLVLCVRVANEEEAKVLERRRREAELQKSNIADHKGNVQDVANKLKFD